MAPSPCRNTSRLRALLLACFLVISLGPFRVGAVEPLKALLITGGGFHDYDRQEQILTAGITARANVRWTIFHENGDTRHELSLYTQPDFAKGFDVVVHNECFADVTDSAFVEKALAPHVNGIPAVVLHCTLHTFRALPSDEWREFIGLSSNHHGKQQPLVVKVLQPAHPIMMGFPTDLVTKREELYSIDKVWANAQPLAQAYADDEKKNDPIIWINLYQGKTRVFGTSLAHNNYTMEDPVYLSLVTRGLLWACGKLGDDGQPLTGYGPQPAPGK